MDDNFSFHPVFVEADGVDAERNADFDFLLQHEDDPDDTYWLSQEQVGEIHERSGLYPKPSEWKEDEGGLDLYHINVTVDKARRFLWKSAKTEIGILRDVWGEDHPSFETLARKIFGPNSRLYHLMQEEFDDDPTDIDMTYEVFCRFLATFFTASMVSQPAPVLYETDLFNTEGLMKEKKDFLQIFRVVERMGVGEDDTLWMKVENCFNRMMKKMFLSKRGKNSLSIALDDDKHHFNYSKNSETYGLARCRHVKDNRMGHVCHTAGLSATGLPLCASFQREGETNTEKYDKMTKDMFGSRTGEAAPDLQGLTFCSDRGYLNPKLVFDLLLPRGADIVGTVARAPWYPFTFSKIPTQAEEEDLHGRIQVPMKGYKDALYRTLKWEDNICIRATAYKSGTGTAVSLALSTIHHEPLFDLNTAFPKDSKHYFNPSQTQRSRNARAFPLVAGSDQYMSEIEALPIDPLTSVQGDTSWFIMRKFSLTSSTVDPMITARAMEISPSNIKREIYETVLSAVGRLHLLPDEPPENEETRSIESNSNEDGSIANDGDVADNPVATAWIGLLNEEDAVDEFLHALQTMNPDVVRAIVQRHKHSKPNAPISTLRKQLERWAHCESAAHRKYHWYNKQQLIDCLRSKDPLVKGSIAQKGKPHILNRLIEAEKRQSRRLTLTRDGEDPFAQTDEVDPVLLQGFKAWYMKQLKGEAKKYCRDGHALEKPFLRELYEHSEDGITLDYNILSIHETPLVESTIEGALDSSDAELIYEKDGIIEAMPVELKARLAHSTFYDERNRLEANVGLAAWEVGDPVYVELDAESDEFHRWIPKHKESFQLLHHVAIRDLRRGLIVIGDKKRIMFGVFVNYQDETINAYREVLSDLFERTLVPFYDDAMPLPGPKIELVMQSEEIKPIGLTVHSFQTSFMIWRKLRIDKCLALPLPPCNRILPYNHSHWNNEKGASDTATKLFWNCKVMTASWGTSQTVVLGKFFQLFSVALHRMHQVATAKTNLNFYASLFHFRNTRNRHEPYHKTLDRLRLFFIQEADAAAASTATPLGDATPDDIENNVPIIPSTPPRTHRDNPRNPFAETRNYASITGGTPGKGKAKFPKTKSREWEADQQRLFRCKGQIHCVSDRSKQQRCYICDSKTTFVCLGCKRFYCFDKTRDEKIKSLISGNKEVVKFLNGVRPPATLDISEFCSVLNSCYHIQHHKAAAEARRPPLPPISELRQQHSSKTKEV